MNSPVFTCSDEAPTRRAAPRRRSRSPDEPPRPSRRNLRHDEECALVTALYTSCSPNGQKNQGNRAVKTHLKADNINAKRVSVQHSLKPNNMYKRVNNNRSGPVKQNDGSQQHNRRARQHNSTSTDLSHRCHIQRSTWVTYTKTRNQSP